MNRTRQNLIIELSTLALCGAGVIYLFYPGYMSYDSIQQLRFAKSGVLPDAHPPLMSLIWRQLDAIYEGPLLMLVSQVAIFALSLFLISRSILKYAPTSRLLVYILLIFPPVLGVAGVIWKDIWMHAFLLLSIAFILLLRDCENRLKLTLSIGALTCLFLATSMRHNAIFAVAPLSILLFFNVIIKQEKDKNRPYLFILSTSSATTIAIFILSIATTNYLSDIKRNFSQVVMAFDIAGTSVQYEKNLFFNDYDELTNGDFKLEDIKSLYTPRYHACLYRPCRNNEPIVSFVQNSSDLEKLRENWISAILESPISWLKHKSLVAREILNLPGSEGLWVPTLRIPIEENPWGIKYNENKIRGMFREVMSNMSTNSIYNPYLYFFASILILISLVPLLLLRLLDAPIAMASATVLLSGLSYEFSLFLGATSADFRYSIWLIICTILGSIFAIAARK